MRKKTLLVALASTAMVSLVACGNNGADSSSSGSSSSGDSSSSGKVTELNIAFAECGFGKKWLTDWETDFNSKNPDNKVKLVLDGDAQMTQNILPRLQSGKNLPDIFMVLSTNWQPWAVQGYLEPLDDVYSAKVSGDKTVSDVIIDGAKTFGKVKDHYWTLPWSVSPCGIIYNKGMFDQYGWKIPTTVGELLTLCETIKTDTSNTVMPFSWSGVVGAYWDFLTFQWWAQAEGVSGWKDFWKFDSAEVYKQTGRLKALQAFQSLICGEGGVAKNSIPGAASKGFIESQMAFVNGEAAMMSNGVWLENEMKNSLPANFQMRLMKAPLVDGAVDSNIAYGTMGDFIGIPKKSSNKEIAKKFLAYTCTEEANNIFVKAAGGLRAFNYDSTKVDGISDFLKDATTNWESSNKVFMTSDNVMYYQNNLNSWPGYGSPYSKMVQEEDSAETVNTTCYNYVSNNWKLFQAEAGEFDS